MSGLLLVELDEVGADVLGLAHEHADRKHRVGHRQGLLRPARALRQHEAGEVGACLGRCRDVLLPGQAADLHERPPEEVRERRSRIGRAHERRAGEEGVRTGELGRRRVSTVLYAALRDHDPVALRVGDEVELGTAVDLERGEVARVQADHLGAERFRPTELLLVVGLYEGLQAELLGGCHELRHRRVVQFTEQKQCGVGPIRAGLVEGRSIKEEPLREEREVGCGTGGPEVFPGSGEAPVDQDRDGCGAGLLEGPSERSRLRVRTEVAGRRRAPLHLGDRAQARGAQGVGESPH
jgi:hypothetical protein